MGAFSQKILKVLCISKNLTVKWVCNLFGVHIHLLITDLYYFTLIPLPV